MTQLQFESPQQQEQSQYVSLVILAKYHISKVQNHVTFYNKA